jgi:hypothetical protein
MCSKDNVLYMCALYWTESYSVDGAWPYLTSQPLALRYLAVAVYKFICKSII